MNMGCFRVTQESFEGYVGEHLGLCRFIYE